MRLFFYGHEQLTWTEYQPVEIRDSKDLMYLQGVERRLVAVVEKYKRPGFTAPQMGIPIQMAVVRVRGVLLTLLNPRIERMYGAETVYPETCISCPPGENKCRVARMSIVEITSRIIDRPFCEQKWVFEGEDARIIQHEIDHLAGTFFFDRASLVDKDKVITKFEEWKFGFKKNGYAFAI